MLRAMTGALVALAAAAAPAEADVFVPADPPANTAGCISAGADVEAVGSRRGEQWLIETSVAGGPWQALERDDGVERCPLVAGAADGTVALLGPHFVRVRPPGGRFGVKVALPDIPQDLAVAPGGHVAVASLRAFTRGVALVASDVAPGGAKTTAVLERASHLYDIRSARIGIDATGRATATWGRWNADSGEYTLRAASTADGITWTPARTLAAGAEPLFDYPSLDQVTVAVAPGGRTLLAWADGRSVYASLDGGPAQRLTTQRNAGSLTAGVADDGSAVVAYAAPRLRILAVDRSADGAWSSPRPLSGAPYGRGTGAPESVPIDVVLAPDGRAVVAWLTPGHVGAQVVAAVRPTGGAWTTPAAPLSAVTREAEAPSLSLDAAGDPHAVWVETVERGWRRVHRVRGARLAAGVSPDTTEPVLDTRLPARSPRTRTGRLAFEIPVSCSEACDARVRFLDRSGREVRAVVRELPAGGRTTVTIKTGPWFGNQLLMWRRERRARFEVIATDRAGNLAREARTVRFRIAHRSLRSFMVPLDHDFLLYTRAANRATARLVNELIDALAGGAGYQDLRRRYLRGVRAIESDEVEFDTPVLDELFMVLQVPFARVGYDAEFFVSV